MQFSLHIGVGLCNYDIVGPSVQKYVFEFYKIMNDPLLFTVIFTCFLLVYWVIKAHWRYFIVSRKERVHVFDNNMQEHNLKEELIANLSVCQVLCSALTVNKGLCPTSE